MNKMSLYVLKAHTSNRYRDLAFAVKPFSVPMFTRLNLMAAQDEKSATDLFKTAVESGSIGVDLQLYPFQVDDGPDADPKDVALSVAFQVSEAERAMAETMKANGLEGYHRVSTYRWAEWTNIERYIKDGSIYGQSDNPAMFECTACGYVKKVTVGGQTYAPEVCPVCSAKQSAFQRYNYIGGW